MPLHVALPFQAVETVDESAREGQRSLGLFGRDQSGDEWRERLILGGKKYVLPVLLGRVRRNVTGWLGDSEW